MGKLSKLLKELYTYVQSIVLDPHDRALRGKFEFTKTKMKKIVKDRLWKQYIEKPDSTINPSLFTADSTITKGGRGCFTELLIKAGRYIGPYKGQLISCEESEKPDYISKYLANLNNLFNVDGSKLCSSFAPFINSNFVDKINCIVATKDIQPGEELFIDYGDEYWYYNKRVNKKGQQVSYGLGTAERTTLIKKMFLEDLEMLEVRQRVPKIVEILGCHISIVKKAVAGLGRQVRDKRNEEIRKSELSLRELTKKHIQLSDKQLKRILNDK